MDPALVIFGIIVVALFGPAWAFSAYMDYRRMKKLRKFDPKKIWGAGWALAKHIRHLTRRKGIPIGFWGPWWHRRWLWFDPQRKGSSPHRITLGGSGSGKTSENIIVA